MAPESWTAAFVDADPEPLVGVEEESVRMDWVVWPFAWGLDAERAGGSSVVDEEDMQAPIVEGDSGVKWEGGVFR